MQLDGNPMTWAPPLKGIVSMVREHAYANSGARIALNDKITLFCGLAVSPVGAYSTCRQIR